MGCFFQITIEKNSDPDFVRGSNQKQFTECDNAFMKNWIWKQYVEVYERTGKKVAQGYYLLVESYLMFHHSRIYQYIVNQFQYT